jgi:hypothetical protein
MSRIRRMGLPEEDCVQSAIDASHFRSIFKMAAEHIETHKKKPADSRTGLGACPET